MQLKLRVGVGDALTINVMEKDTFQDLSDKLYSHGGVRVDLSQLKSNDKPFDMSTNVMDYFLPQNKESKTEECNRPRRLCRLCALSITSEPVFLFEEVPSEDKITLVEKVNSSLPIHVSKHDHLPKQVCEMCCTRVNKSFSFMRAVVDAQKTLERIYNLKPKEKPVTNYREEANCPLCPEGHLKRVDYMLRQVIGSQREKTLRKEVLISVPKGVNRESKKEMNRLAIKEEPLESDFYSDDIVTGYWDPSQEMDHYGVKKNRKRVKPEDDHDWTIDEEYVPVSRRGRPRGTKNKPKVPVPIVEKTCALCRWAGADTDIFAHAINQHCQPDMGYFPCPICKTNQPNEMVLENHIDRHNAQTRKKVEAASSSH